MVQNKINGITHIALINCKISQHIIVAKKNLIHLTVLPKYKIGKIYLPTHHIVLILH